MASILYGIVYNEHPQVHRRDVDEPRISSRPHWYRGVLMSARHVGKIMVNDPITVFGRDGSVLEKTKVYAVVRINGNDYLSLSENQVYIIRATKTFWNNGMCCHWHDMAVEGCSR